MSEAPSDPQKDRLSQPSAGSALLRAAGLFVFRLLHISACIVVLGGLALLAVEESDVLPRLLERSLEYKLRELGSLKIERVSLRWFEPGIVLEGVTLRSPAGEQHLRLDSVRLSFLPDLRRDGPLRQLRLDGGEIRISNTLLEALDRFSRSVTDAEGNAPRFSPPPFTVTDFDILVELPDGSDFNIGSVDLEARDSEGGFDISGLLYPSLEQAVPPDERAQIRIHGLLLESVVELEASAVDIPLESSSFRMPAILGSPPIDAFEGRLILDASGRLEFGDQAVAEGRLRARLYEARLRPAADGPWLEDVQVDVDAAFHPGLENSLWDRESWTVASTVDASWSETPVHAYAELGTGVPDGGWAHLWGRAERLPLSESTLETLRAVEVARESWEALAPNGFADTTIDIVLRRQGDLGQWEQETAVHMRHAKESGVTFHGFTDLEGQRFGIPMPVTRLSGQSLFTSDDRRPRPFRLALIDMQGEHGSGIVEGWSVMASPPPGRPQKEFEFDLVFTVPEIAVDERMRAALHQNEVLREIWPTYDPLGGSAASTWRFRAGPETGGLTAMGSVVVKDTSMRWNELPVPLNGTSGELTMIWAEKPAVVADGPPGMLYRPFGILYEFSNDDGEGRGVRANITGFAREESMPATILRSDIAEQWVQGIDITIPELLLRGKDWDILADSYPDVEEQALELGAKGSVAAHFVGSQAHAEMTYVTDIEVTPNEVEATPTFFERPTQNIDGRILVRGETFEDGREDIYEARMILAGAWPGGVELVVDAHIPSVGPAEVHTYGAGLDATNTAFKGALIKALNTDEEAGGGGFDIEPAEFKESALGGRVDFTIETTFISESEDAAKNDYRVFLRGNDLEHEGLRLESLRGILEQSGDILRSFRLDGAIAGHPIVLRNVVVFALDRLADVPEADPAFRRTTFDDDPNAFGIQAQIYTTDLPLDDEHLSAILDPETLEQLSESGSFGGLLDVDGAHLLMTSMTDETRDQLILHGPLRPHDVTLRFGIPIEMSSAEIDLRDFVYEAGRARGWGAIENLSAKIADRELTEANMIIGYVDGRLTIDNLSGNFEGGRLESLGEDGTGSRKAIGVDLAEPYRFDIAVRMDKVHVDRLLKGVFTSSVADAGLLDASLQLSGAPGDVLGLTGRGQLRLTEGRLWSIPTMRELFTQLGFPNTAVFDRMRARFELRDGVIDTSYVQVRSALLNLVGQGTLDLDGALAYELEVRFSLLDKLGIFNRVLYWLNNSIWRVAIHGSFARPFVSIRKPFLEIFQRKKELPRSIPLPGFAPLVPRF